MPKWAPYTDLVLGGAGEGEGKDAGAALFALVIYTLGFVLCTHVTRRSSLSVCPSVSLHCPEAGRQTSSSSPGFPGSPSYL